MDAIRWSLRNSPVPLRIAVLMGGVSEERDISRNSGAAVTAALRERGHEVREVDPADGRLTAADLAPSEVVFNALHGRFGEDGQVQQILERLGIPYAGSGVAASRLAFSKSAAKECFVKAGVPTPAGELIHRGDSEARWFEFADRLGYPLVVKPDQQGSSLGVSIVAGSDELLPAIERCFQYGPFGLLEACIVGTEWTVPLIDDHPLPVIQIVPRASFFDFHSKYLDEQTGYRFEFDVAESVVQAVRETAVAAGRSLNVAGISRVDLRVDAAGRPWVLEINTSPGMTDHSLTPKSAARAGFSLGELCEQVLRQALEQPAQRSAA